MRVATLFLFVLVSFPVFAAKQVSVAQLEKEVAAVAAKPDSAAAHAIAKLELKERLDRRRLEQLGTQLPGEESRAALMQVADVAAFLPAARPEEKPPAAPPVEEQRRMVEATVAYVANEIPRLPSFIAQKRTLRFEQELIPGPSSGPYLGPLHVSNVEDEKISFNDGKEVLEPVAIREVATGKTGPDRGLHTWGEFGPILALVLTDATHNKLSWHGWEPGGSGNAAVFAFDVPAKASHYTVHYCCVHDAAGGMRPFEKPTGYHGLLVVDPPTGAVLRLELRAALHEGDPITASNLLVDYGPVEIGGKTFICPISSVALFKVQGENGPDLNAMAGARSHLVAGGSQNTVVSPEHIMINDASFTGYHQFRTESRIVNEAAGNRQGPTGPEQPAADEVAIPVVLQK